MCDYGSLNFLDDQGIVFEHLGVAQSASALDPVSEEVVLEALEVILNPRNYPLIVMCNLGRHRTGAFGARALASASSASFGSANSRKTLFTFAGTVVGCLRKLQRWALTAISQEYRRYAGPKVRLLNEQFIELFDTDLVRLPIDRPRWL